MTHACHSPPPQAQDQLLGCRFIYGNHAATGIGSVDHAVDLVHDQLWCAEHDEVAGLSSLDPSSVGQGNSPGRPAYFLLCGRGDV